MRQQTRSNRVVRRAIALLVLIAAAAALAGCGGKEPQYGTERQITLPGKRQVWAVAPALNLSGEAQVDPILQADLVYQQLQQVDGLIVVPVNRVAEVYASLRIERVQSEEQAGAVCEILGCDGLVVPTVTAYDPYDPPKFGAALQLFRRSGRDNQTNVSPRELARRAAPGPEQQSLPARPQFVQVVGMFDASNGSVRRALHEYAAGRNDPVAALGPRSYLVSMDRFCGFAYYMLIDELVAHPRVSG